VIRHATAARVGLTDAVTTYAYDAGGALWTITSPIRVSTPPR